MEQTGQDIFNFLSQYGYWVMLPLMIIEGPIASIISATLAAMGVFNIWVVFVFSILGDVLGDILFYLAGYKWGMSFVKNFGRHIGITEKMVLRMEEYFKKHGGKTIFAVKATTGICWATFTTAGIVKMDFGKFLKYSILGGIVWSGFLVSMGYFYGYLWREIGIYIKWAGWIVLVLTVFSIVLITLYKRKQAKNILK